MQSPTNDMMPVAIEWDPRVTELIDAAMRDGLSRPDATWRVIGGLSRRSKWDSPNTTHKGTGKHDELPRTRHR